MSKVGVYLGMPNTTCSSHPTKSGRAIFKLRRHVPIKNQHQHKRKSELRGRGRSATKSCLKPWIMIPLLSVHIYNRTLTAFCILATVQIINGTFCEGGSGKNKTFVVTVRRSTME